MRLRERVTLNQVSAPNRKVSAGLAGNRKSTVHRNFSGMEKLLDLQRSHGNAFVQRLMQRTLMGEESKVFPGGHDTPHPTTGAPLVTDRSRGITFRGNASGYAAIRRQEPAKKQTPLDNLDEDLGQGGRSTVRFKRISKHCLRVR